MVRALAAQRTPRKQGYHASRGGRFGAGKGVTSASSRTLPSVSIDDIGSVSPLSGAHLVTNPPVGVEHLEQDEERREFSELFAATAPRIHAYARRHVGHDAADDIVAETFTTAWRRRTSIPVPALPWLIVVARYVIANRRRSIVRADRVWREAVLAQWHTTGSPEDDVADRHAILAALDACTPVEREALLLVAWDGLTIREAAAVAGCSARAFTVRLYRARRRLELSLDRSHDSGIAPRDIGTTGTTETTGRSVTPAPTRRSSPAGIPAASCPLPNPTEG